MPMQEELLDFLKQKVLPELQDMKTWRIEMKAELTVINGRLDGFDKRFEQVDKRFEEVLDQMRSRFEQVERRFDRVDKRFEDVDKRFNLQDRRMEELHDDLRELRSYSFRSRFEENSCAART